MNLTKRQVEMIEFCEDPKLVSEIAARFQINERSVYPYLRRLINGGFIKPETGYMNEKRRTVKLFVSIVPVEKIHLGQSDLVDEKKINMDFVKVAHNPFNLGVRHG